MLAATGRLDAWLDENTHRFNEALACGDVASILGPLSENRGTPKKAMLSAACMTGGRNARDVAHALIQSGGFDVNHKNANGFTALTWCCIRGDADTTADLIAANADVDTFDEQGFTPLSWACVNGHLEVVKKLLKHGAARDLTTTCGTSPLTWSCGSGHRAVVAFLLDQGANVNTENDKGETPLTTAYAHGHMELAQDLIARGADVNAGATPVLLWAAMNGFEDIAEDMIDANADVNGRCRVGGYTALYSACRRGSLGLVRALVDQGADVNAAIGNDSRRPLHTAAVNGYTDIVQLLLERGADVDPVSATGYTPLHFSFKKTRKDGGAIARALVQAGADLYLTANGLSGACGLNLSSPDGERQELIEVARRRRNWEKRRDFVMFLAQMQVIPTATRRTRIEMEAYTGPDQVGGSTAGAEVLRMLHRDIASFL